MLRTTGMTITVIVMALAAVFLIGCTTEVNVGEDNQDTQGMDGISGLVVYETEPQSVVIYEQEDSGRAVFTITDALVNMNNINEFWVTVDEVEIQTQTEGWVTVSSEEHRYDLLQLREDDEQGILADVSLAPGTYQQVRLSISDVEVIDEDGTHDVVIPSGVLRFTAPFTVESDSLSVIQFDFQIDSSLHITSDGRYVFVPVVRVVDYSNAEIRVSARERVIIEQGSPESTLVVRSDVEGNVREDIVIPSDITITVQDGVRERIIIQNRTVERRTVINNTVVIDNDDENQTTTDDDENRTMDDDSDSANASANMTMNATVNISG